MSKTSAVIVTADRRSVYSAATDNFSTYSAGVCVCVCVCLNNLQMVDNALFAQRSFNFQC